MLKVSIKALAGFAGLALLSAAAPASAQIQASGQPAPAKNTDPNRIICEKIRETGSRLNTRKVCLTAQQWEEQRQRDREAVQDAQQRRTEPSGG